MRKQWTARKIYGVLALTAIMAGTPGAASAQSFFELLFGGFRRAPASAAPSQPVRSFSDPRFDDRADDDRRFDSGGGGPGGTYCVRLCDGRHFPVSARGGASAADICRSFCPAAQTQIYSGSGIERAIAPNGRRYSDLPNAFVYREKLVPDCTCDGKSPTGLARLDPDNDPTLHPGDIVATNSGLMAYTGDSRRNAQFTPISRVPGLPPAVRQQLAATKVQPTRSTEEVGTAAAAATSRNVPQRDQASR